MPEPIIYIDRSRILPGKLEELKTRIAELVDFIGQREPQLLFYGFYLDEGSGRMTVVAVHPDAASVELHMDVGAAAFRRFADLIEMEGIEVYGEASDRMLEQLQQKAHDLGKDGSVRIDQLQAGFSRVVESAGRLHH